MKEVSFKTPLYEAEVTYLIGGDVKDLKNFLRSKNNGRLPTTYSWDQRFTFGKDGDTTNAYQFHVNAPLGDGEIFYVWVADPTMDLLTHETTHLTGDILYTRGFGYCYESEEAWAYLNGWLFDKIFHSIFKNPEWVAE